MKFRYKVMMKMLEIEEFAIMNVKFIRAKENRSTGLTTKSDSDILKLLFEIYVTGNKKYEEKYLELSSELTKINNTERFEVNIIA